MPELTHDTLVIRRSGLSRDLPPSSVTDGLAWVTNTATLVLGTADAVLVDTFPAVDQNDRLVEWVAGHGRRLTHVYVTHAHGDHALGVGQVLSAFPDAVAVATPGTVAAIRRHIGDGSLERPWEEQFPGQVPRPRVPDEVRGDAIELEGHELRIIPAGHTDTHDTTAMWVPDLGLVVAGDVVYNHVHPFLGETTTESRREWLGALRLLADLAAAKVVAGHTDPARGDSASAVGATIRYFEDFAEGEDATTTALELYGWMLRRHGDRLNPGSLWRAAKLVKPAPEPVP